MRGYRYRAYDGGPDPLAPPFDAGAAMDDLGRQVLTGRTPDEALRSLLRRGLDGRAGLEELRRRIRQRREEVRQSGRLDGLLEEARDLLDTALGQERAELFRDPGDDARFRELQLDALPDSLAGAVRELRSYDWRSEPARETYRQLLERLRSDVLDQQFRGLSQGLQDMQSPETRAALADMLGDLNELLQAHRRGEDTQAGYQEFLDKHGQLFPDAPDTFEEFLDELARRAAAAQRLLQSLTDEQRQELAELGRAVLDDLDLAAQMAQLTDNLQALRPGLQWSGTQTLSGQQGLGLPDATEALAELADLDSLDGQLADASRRPDLADIDVAAVRRSLGRAAADDAQALLEARERLQQQGYLTEHLELTPKAVRRIGMQALRTVFRDLDAAARGDHDINSAGSAGEVTGQSRAWQFGDEQPLDVVGTVRNATFRHLLQGDHRGRTGAGVSLSAEDFEVLQTEDRTRAAVALLVDRSFSMVVNDTWQPAKVTALALHTLAAMAHPADAVQIITFANLAQVVPPNELPALEASEVQGTNLHHALRLATRFLERHRDAERICMVITDGEPTAHLLPDGDWWFDWPPSAETIELTIAEIDGLTRRGVPISWFRLGDEPRLARFLDGVARRSGGRVLAADSGRLGRYVVSDYVRRRHRGRRAV